MVLFCCPWVRCVIFRCDGTSNRRIYFQLAINRSHFVNARGHISVVIRTFCAECANGACKSPWFAVCPILTVLQNFHLFLFILSTAACTFRSRRRANWCRYADVVIGNFSAKKAKLGRNVVASQCSRHQRGQCWRFSFQWAGKSVRLALATKFVANSGTGQCGAY